MKQQPLTSRIGILGGGQLAKMLGEASIKLGLNISAYVEPNSESAATVIRNITRGNLQDTIALRKYLQSVDIAIFESEFVPTFALREASKDLPVLFYPSIDAIAFVQEKLLQKKSLENWNIPTAKFISHELNESVDGFLSRVKETFPDGAVLKWSTLGYDGKGVLVLRPNYDKTKVDNFCNEVLSRNGGLFAEALIPFEKEIACIGVRSTSGECLTYPVVVSEQDNGICNKVYGPAEEFGIHADTVNQVKEIVKSIGKNGNLIGSYGIELFLTKGGKVLVNEIAPRVHNTGHYTQDASVTSQFENHLRAVLSLPLGDPSSKGLFVMQNILGPDGSYKIEGSAPIPSGSNGIFVHWYEKSGVTPRRKLGHINGIAQNKGDFASIDQQIAERYAKWNDTILTSGKGKPN